MKLTRSLIIMRRPAGSVNKKKKQSTSAVGNRRRDDRPETKSRTVGKFRNIVGSEEEKNDSVWLVVRDRRRRYF